MINIKEYITNCENLAKKEFQLIDEIALFNQKKVLDAFRKNKINPTHFCGTSGYGYDDVGRDTLCRLFSDVLGTESAIVSPLIANGTHAITLTLFGLLRPNDLMLSIAGKPYDTLDEVINGAGNGSLADFGVKYQQIDLLNDTFDYNKIEEQVKTLQPKVVFIQRSKGYSWREAFSVYVIEKAVKLVKEIDSNIIVVVDNCYGEFVEDKEPSEVGADVIIGSLIKNIGGGIAPTGGYIAGKAKYIEQISYRMTAPSLGMEVGSYISGYLPYYQGLFLAPSTVKNALKGSVLAGYALKKFGYETMPKVGQMPYDIIKSIKFNNRDQMIKFCQLIQQYSPVDSYVTPEPWGMPGYNDEVIMAAGTFVQGASLELTADGAVREPYVAYLQGGLTYEHYKIVLMEIVEYFEMNK